MAFKDITGGEKIAKVLANSEGLPNHFRAIKERFIDED